MMHLPLRSALAFSLCALPLGAQLPIDLYVDPLPSSVTPTGDAVRADFDGDHVTDIVFLQGTDIVFFSGPGRFESSSTETASAIEHLALLVSADGKRVWLFGSDGSSVCPIAFDGRVAIVGAPILGSASGIRDLGAWSSPGTPTTGWVSMLQGDGTTVRASIDMSQGTLLGSDTFAAAANGAHSSALADTDGDGTPEVFAIAPTTIAHYGNLPGSAPTQYGSASGEVFSEFATVLRHGSLAEELAVASLTVGGAQIRLYGTSQSPPTPTGFDEVTGMTSMHFDWAATDGLQDVLFTCQDDGGAFLNLRVLQRLATPGSGGQLLGQPHTIEFGFSGGYSSPLAGDFDGDRDWDVWFCRVDELEARMYLGAGNDESREPAIISDVRFPGMTTGRGPWWADEWGVWEGGDVELVVPVPAEYAGSTVEVSYWNVIGPIHPDSPIADVPELTETVDHDPVLDGDAVTVEFVASYQMSQDPMFYIEVRMLPSETSADGDAALPSSFYASAWDSRNYNTMVSTFGELLSEDLIIDFRGGSGGVISGGGRIRGGRIRK